MLMRTRLNSSSATALHDIADVFWLNASSNEWLYVVVVQFLQLQTQHETETRECVKLHKTTKHRITRRQNKKAVLLQETTARCGTLVQNACT